MAGLLRARGWVFWTRVAGNFERVAGKVLIYSQMSTSFPLPEPGEDAHHFIDYQIVGRHANNVKNREQLHHSCFLGWKNLSLLLVKAIVVGHLHFICSCIRYALYVWGGITVL